MIYASVCSGIEAPSVAWEGLGWKPAWFSEIASFPSALLTYRFPNVPNLGDMSLLHERPEFQDSSIDLLVGGTPCQSFSVAGLRKGLDDPRGNLALVFLRLAKLSGAKWLVWENVPGVLSSNRGRDFGSFLGALSELGYGWSYRILDAQYFGVPQRRRRVFLVAYLGDPRPAAAVLFEPKSLFRGIKKSSSAENKASHLSYERIAHCLQTTCSDSTRADGFNMIVDHLNLEPLAFHATQDPISGSVTPALAVKSTTGILYKGVRRLTPIECERLQGFPDNYTLVPYNGKMVADYSRYRALGNSMAVPVMRWIGHRIQEVDSIVKASR
jgi:DNA (cytosine-5)-methyltransferase 1